MSETKAEGLAITVWHDEADRLAVWGCLDPTDACMCRDCVLPTDADARQDSHSGHQSPGSTTAAPGEVGGLGRQGAEGINDEGDRDE